VRAVTTLAKDADATMRALKISARQSGEVARNRALRTGPTMAAMDRYTGVLYDALDPATLDGAARTHARESLVIQSALLGPIGALDPIPAYRLSFDSRIPDLPLKAHWASRAGEVLDTVPGLVLDMRSEGYAALAPLPASSERRYLRVVTRGDDGTTRALNHFNKSAKGTLTRALLHTETPPGDVAGLIAWADSRGIELNEGAPGELDLVVPPGRWAPNVRGAVVTDSA
jgi:cytoplasmic iron level regulating protein YaaA (DUF328/UPF0246 family)